MQHPVGHEVSADGTLALASFASYLFNPWAIWEYLHTMSAAVITGGFVVAAVGAYWTLSGRHLAHARLCLRAGVVAALIASVMQIFPTGDQHGKLLARYQQPTLAAMEGKFDTSKHAELVIIGQPDLEHRTLQNPVEVPEVLSFLAYGSFGAEVKGLNDIPHSDWPDHIELLYYAYHVMVGLGTLFIAVLAVAALLLWRGRLDQSRPMLWTLMLGFPFPYIATAAGWLTAELGRQPWLIYGILRTADGSSPSVPGGDVIFSLLGWLGLYFVVGVLFLFLIGRQVVRGPVAAGVH